MHEDLPGDAKLSNTTSLVYSQAWAPRAILWRVLGIPKVPQSMYFPQICSFGIGEMVLSSIHPTI